MGCLGGSGSARLPFPFPVSSNCSCCSCCLDCPSLFSAWKMPGVLHKAQTPPCPYSCVYYSLICPFTRSFIQQYFSALSCVSVTVAGDRESVNKTAGPLPPGAVLLGGELDMTQKHRITTYITTNRESAAEEKGTVP